jgi:hypothetical protein
MWAFGYCSSLEKAILPPENTVLGTAIFGSCESLVEVVLPNELDYLLGSEFQLCKSLKKIVIPKSVKRIETYSFFNCISLEELSYEGTVAQWNSVVKEKWWNYNAGIKVVHCSDGDIEITE